jgi:penicillin-binding protein 2
MSGFLSQFGFGRRSGVDLDGELAGLMPTPEWKKKRFKQPWWTGETVIAGIGQGYVLATPMQLAVATMAIANNGTVYKPQLIRAWRDPVTGKVSQAAPQVMSQIELKPEHLRLVKEAMVEVTQPGGTASIAGANTPYLFAGKTGTAQVVGIRQGESYNASRVALRNRDHALFVSFAPADAPKIVVAVMVENGGHGGSTAAPVARKVIDYWLLGKLPDAPIREEPEGVAEDTEDTAAEDTAETPATSTGGTPQ